MPKVSWSAILAAFLAVLATVLALTDKEADAVAMALVSITFALLSHRDT